MPIKNKHKKANVLDFDFGRITAGIGFAAMSAAAVVSLVELEHFRAQKVEAMQPAFASVTANPIETSRGEELMRREKEESPHSIVSYGVTMRSHPVTGKA